MFVAAFRIALATLVPTLEVRPVFVSAFVTILLSVEGVVTALGVVPVLVLLTPEELAVVEAAGLAGVRLMKVTDPAPGVVPPLVLVTLEPGVVGMVMIGTIPVLLLVLLVEVPVVRVTLVRLELTPDEAVPDPPPPDRPVETTVPTVAMPTGRPRNAAPASRLLGAKLWIFKPPVDVVPAPPDSTVRARIGVPTVMLMAPGLEAAALAIILTTAARRSARSSVRRSCRTFRSSILCSCLR